MKSKNKQQKDLNQQSQIGQPSIELLTFDDHANDYMQNVVLSNPISEGEVETAFVCGMMKANDQTTQLREENERLREFIQNAKRLDDFGYRYKLTEHLKKSDQLLKETE